MLFFPYVDCIYRKLVQTDKQNKQNILGGKNIILNPPKRLRFLTERVEI